MRFSGGQRQMIGIIIALYIKYKILILYEVTIALSSYNQAAVINSLTALNKKLKIIMIVFREITLEECKNG